MTLKVLFAHIDGEIFSHRIKHLEMFVVQEKVYLLIFKTSPIMQIQTILFVHAFDKQRNRKGVLCILTSNTGIKAMSIYKRQKPPYTNLFLFLSSHKDPT